MAGDICDVCGMGGVVGVASSIAPISVAFCGSCIAVGAHPLWVLEAQDECCNYQMHPEYYEIYTFFKGGYVRYGELTDRESG